MLDIIIVNGSIYDGTGRSPYRADIGIKDGKIACIGNIESSCAHKVIEAKELAVCPGFIDTHSHSDIMALWKPALLPKLMQGVTTELLGQDGIGPAPLNSDIIDSWRGYLAGLSGNPPLEWNWQEFKEYLSRLELQHTGPNMVSLLPYGNVRMRVAKLMNVNLNDQQMKLVKEEVLKGMKAGAVGMSLGMVYIPCTYAKREELVQAYTVCGHMGGFMAVHIRNASSLLLESIEEVIDIARSADVPLHISHFKAAGRRNWSKMEAALKLLDRAKDQGLDISFDIYPYTAGSTMFSALLPPWALEGGMSAALERLRDSFTRKRIKDEFTCPPKPDPSSAGWDNHAHLNGWENIVISSTKNDDKAVVGKSVAEIAENRNQDPAETAFDLLIEEEGDVGMIIFSMSEDNVAMGLRHPLGMICTDGLLGGKPHPRAYGTFPKVLARYVRERKDLTLEEAIRKMTSYPAKRLGLSDRGIIKENMAADIVVLSPDLVIDQATYEKPRQYPKGIKHVFVNGVQSVEKGKFTGQLAGKLIKRTNIP